MSTSHWYHSNCTSHRAAAFLSPASLHRVSVNTLLIAHDACACVNAGMNKSTASFRASLPCSWRCGGAPSSGTRAAPRPHSAWRTACSSSHTDRCGVTGLGLPWRRGVDKQLVPRCLFVWELWLVRAGCSGKHVTAPGYTQSACNSINLDDRCNSYGGVLRALTELERISSSRDRFQNTDLFAPAPLLCPSTHFVLASKSKCLTLGRAVTQSYCCWTARMTRSHLC